MVEMKVVLAESSSLNSVMFLRESHILLLRGTFSACLHAPHLEIAFLIVGIDFKRLVLEVLFHRMHPAIPGAICGEGHCAGLSPELVSARLLLAEG